MNTLIRTIYEMGLDKTVYDIFFALGFVSVMTGLIWCILEGWKIEAFVEGFFWPFVCIIITSIFGLPVYFIGKKHPKAANYIKKIGLGIGVIFVVLLLLLVIFG